MSGSGPSVPIVRRRDGSPRVVLSLRTWLLATHLAVFALPILVLLGSGAMARDLRNQTLADLEHQAVLLGIVASDLVAHEREHAPGAGLVDVGEALSARLRAAKKVTLAGVQAVDAQGVVVATSGTTLGQDLSDDEEVQQVLGGARRAVVVRPRAPARLPLDSPSRRASVRLFVAVPVEVDGEVLGALVLSRTPREEMQVLYQMAPGPLLIGALLALGLTLGGGLVMGVLLTRSLRTVAGATADISEGRWDGMSALGPPRQSHVADVALLAGSVATMATRLRERLGYIGEFASNVSHEFKTPLATLRGTLELLGDDDGTMPAEQRTRFLANAEAELGRLQRLVDGLLGLARAEEVGGRTRLELDDVLDAVAARHGVVRTGASGAVDASRSQLESVADNLVANALRYGSAPVEIRAFAEPGSVGFEVVDSGPGVSEANRAKIFERFFTTGRDQGGTGLGLALVRTVVESHGGTVTVDSRPGRTVFRVALPRA